MSVTDIRIVNVNTSWFSFVIRLCKLKKKKKIIAEMLEILVPPGRVLLVGPGLSLGHQLKEQSGRLPSQAGRGMLWLMVLL